MNIIYIYLIILQENVITILFWGQEYKFEILDVIVFSSMRKMMSVITREVGKEEMVMYSKGADTAIMSRLDLFTESEELRQAVQEL